MAPPPQILKGYQKYRLLYMQPTEYKAKIEGQFLFLIIFLIDTELFTSMRFILKLPHDGLIVVILFTNSLAGLKFLQSSVNLLFSRGFRHTPC